MASLKTPVIEYLFKDSTRWKDGQVGGELIRPVVTLDETNRAIAAVNAKGIQEELSTRNPSAFFKDFGRRTKSAEKHWPPSVLVAGYTGQQKKGQGAAFEFFKLPPNQTTAFVAATAEYPRYPASTKLQAVQTLSLPQLVKALARKDENWLQTLAVSLHIPHTHIALHPDPSVPLIEMGHMQSNMKLRTAEIDGLYLGVLESRDALLMTMEAKSDVDDISEPQVIGQIEAIRSLSSIKAFLQGIKADEAAVRILPMAMKLVDATCLNMVPGSEEFQAVGSKLLYLVDYGTVPYLGSKPDQLTPRGETLFDLRPAIKGVNA
ncbi:hypothetical protein [Paraburkholderia bannensis]|uniref:hypothetical protein n=1 Tax=Paraburkholderia bannensis TaxID=765414 RepID=UPI002ABE2B0C|nr:hypothetical protein [Paraburkholderia bannensis]